MKTTIYKEVNDIIIKLLTKLTKYKTRTPNLGSSFKKYYKMDNNVSDKYLSKYLKYKLKYLELFIN